MRKHLNDCITGNFNKKYILPFFWQHGESPEVLLNEIEAIKNSGIDEFCVESRVHEQFCEEKWWKDFDLILKEAEKRKMRVWLLDDKCFPTGYANNYISGHQNLRKTSLRIVYRDFFGSGEESAIVPVPLEEEEEYAAIVAYKRDESGEVLNDGRLNITRNLNDGLIYFNIPDGFWRVYYIIKTKKATNGKENYIDMMSQESCLSMIYGVYEPHYKHFKKYFGNTFAGFFSDEPGFNNEVGTYDSRLGRPHMLVPWNDGMVKLLSQKMNVTDDEILLMLPLLWYNIDTRLVSFLRGAYMDIVSKLYSENFSWMIGNWCREHNVMYIGHIIEDMNAHMRLGHGAAHYFRALDGQDMAGMDIVLQQIIPGMTDINHSASLYNNNIDATFFTYALAKMTASHSHIQPLKENRAMCEIYGAFGWVEGMPFMKQLTDHMLVNGINYFVPHAFSAKYPDLDCPPHFYINGKNPQYKLFGKLMEYTQKCCHLLSSGVHQASVAVLYNAEAEWANGEYMLFQEVAKKLTKNQIDFDILPEDALFNCKNADGNILVNKEKYKALIVPYSEILPFALIATINKMANQGIKVFFVDDLPSFSTESESITGMLEKCQVVKLENLTNILHECGCYEILVSEKTPSLRCYHIKENENDTYMFLNEDMIDTVDVIVTLPDRKKFCFYDVWKNNFTNPQQKDNVIRIKLAPWETIILVNMENTDDIKEHNYFDKSAVEIDMRFYVSVKENGCDGFSLYRQNTKLFNITDIKHLPRFCGSIRYEGKLENKTNYTFINLGNVGETAELWLNGVYCGAKIGKPYTFDLTNAIKEGGNDIVIEVINNIAYRERDILSTYTQLPPSGITGPIKMG